jgi:uncharacterized protein YciI
MFIILVTYTKPVEIVDIYLHAHAAYLDTCYKKNRLVVSGPKNPRNGGVIISQLKDRQQIEEIIQHDPYHINNVADFEIIEFNPRVYHPDFTSFM